MLTPATLCGQGALGNAEVNRRQQAALEARELLVHGDGAYESGDYAQAVEAYTGALEGLPDAAATATLRGAAIDRLVIASIERARAQVRLGDLAGARATIDTVLAEGVAPGDSRALKARGEIDDPIRTNQGLTPEHVANVDEVRRLLYTAEGHFNLGRYDDASVTYQKVLQIDPTNKAARRGMERAAAARSDYYRAAFDQTRAEMLMEVDREWELQVKPPAEQVPALDGGTGPAPWISVESKLDRIVFPIVDMEDTSLAEAADFIRAQTRTLDLLEIDPQKRGVAIVLDLGPADTPEGTAARSAIINLKLRNVPLRNLLDYLTKASRTEWSLDEYAVVIRPAGSTSTVLVSRNYRVPPDFLSTGSGGAGAATAAVDPFAADSGDDGLLARRLTARQVLEEQGVNFPEGATATFNNVNSTLTVRTTNEMQRFVEQIVAASAQTEPVQVVVKVTMMKVEEQRLKELGFDWLLGPAPIGNNLFLSGGTVGNGTPRTNADFINPVNYTSIPGVPGAGGQDVSNILTAGNRSGDAAVPGNSIDAIINDPRRTAVTNRVAPGVLGLTGLLDKVQFQVMIRAIENQKGVDVLSTPSTVTRSGQRSSIKVVREFIYPTEYEPPELPNSVGSSSSFSSIGGSLLGSSSSGASPVTPATPTAFEVRDVGMVLEVEPVVGPNRKFIDVVLNPVFTEFEGFVNYGTPISSSSPGGNALFGSSGPVEVTANAILMPVFSVNRADTSLTVADGATIVIGGLMQEQMVKVEDKIPLLGDIPFLGRFFRSDVSAPQRKVIMFFVNVELLDPTGRRFRDR